MKVIIRFCKSWGSINTFMLDIEESLNPNELFDKIREKIKLKTNNFIARFSRDGFMVSINQFLDSV